MQLHVHSDASYLTENKSRSRGGGHFFLSSKADDPNRQPKPNDPMPPDNGAVLNVSPIMKPVFASVAEAELGALFFNGQDADHMKIALEEMNHLQDPIPMVTDNSTASGISNKTVKQRRSKAIDMRFYWLQDRVEQGRFLIYWRPGSDNRADYFTKDHAVHHHRKVRPVYLHKRKVRRYT